MCLLFPFHRERKETSEGFSSLSSSILQENEIIPKIPIILKKEVEKNNVAEA